MQGIRIFGAVDRKNRDPKGAICSHMPAWYLDAQTSEMEYEVERDNQRIKAGEIPLDERPYVQSRVQMGNARIESIKSSKPTLRGKDKDKVVTFVEGLGSDIGAAMFSDSDMRRGTANVHQEADRMMTGIIKVNEEVAASCGVRVYENGKVDRDGATKIWQIGRKMMEESTNPELLRREN